MSDQKCARALVKAAESDMRALQGMSAPEFFSDEIIGFHAQQAAEKLLKAWIALLGFTFPLTHDLGALLDMLSESEPDAKEFRGLIALNPFAVQFRYEGIGEEMEPLDRDSLVEELRLLHERVHAALQDREVSS